jgi:hypothetical protein
VAVYTVYEPPNAPADRVDRAEALTFIRDGFSWGAALVPPVWFALRGEWLALALYTAAALILGYGLTAAGAQPNWVALVLFVFNLLLGFEADTLRRWSLARAGWREIGAVSGRNRDECERRFFEGWLPREPVIAGRSRTDTAGTLAASAGVVAERGRHGPRPWRGLFWGNT